MILENQYETQSDDDDSNREASNKSPICASIVTPYYNGFQVYAMARLSLSHCKDSICAVWHDFTVGAQQFRGVEWVQQTSIA